MFHSDRLKVIEIRFTRAPDNLGEEGRKDYYNTLLKVSVAHRTVGVVAKGHINTVLASSYSLGRAERLRFNTKENCSQSSPPPNKTKPSADETINYSSSKSQPIDQ